MGNTGADGIVWAGLLELTLRDGPLLEGRITWQSADGKKAQSSGVELLRGCYHYEINLLTLKCHSLLNAKGDIGSGANYEAEVSSCGLHLRNGHWFGNPFNRNVEDGSWSARFVGEQLLPAKG